MSGDWLEVGLGALLAFAEAMLGVGIVLPGEVMVTGVASSLEGDARIALFLAVALGASAGDHVNYWIGRALGPRLSGSRLVARIGLHHWDRAVRMTQRYGAWAVVLSRLVPVVRTLMAAVAGVSHLRYRSFASASLAGSALWAGIWVAAGRALGNLLADALLLLPVGAALVLALLVRSAHRRAAGGLAGVRSGLTPAPTRC